MEHLMKMEYMLYVLVKLGMNHRKTSLKAYSGAESPRIVNESCSITAVQV